MRTALYSKEQSLIMPVATGPCVSIILPFEPKMEKKSSLEIKLQRSIEKAEKQLLEEYPSYTTRLILKKLNALVKTIDYATHRKSIALFVDASDEKIIYLNILVEEKVIVDKSFEIRDIILNKQLHPKYLLLVIGDEQERLFLGTGDNLMPLIINSNTTSEGSFIHQVDDGLSIILKAYPLPLFLACSKTIKEEFLRISKNADKIIEYIPGNYSSAGKAQLKILVRPYLNDWQKIKEKDILFQLQKAIATNKCSLGINEVFAAANKKHGNFLIVERNFTQPAFLNEQGEINTTNTNNGIYIKDAVDDAMEKVLVDGGDVEFVSDGVLKDYGHIALI
jgi:hypothetical protein